MKQIETGIPVPENIEIKVGRPRIHPFLEMKISDSVVYSREEWKKARNSLYHAIRKGLRFTTTISRKDGTIRVWRIG